jgi:hypothetical protein
MENYIRALRTLCEDNSKRTAPYLVRTRFERSVFGLLVSFSEFAFGARPSGMSEDHIREFLARHDVRHKEKEAAIVRSFSRLFTKFTYLCDTSHWSDDGQDPRVEACRSEILELCDTVESVNDYGPCLV